MHDCIVVGAGLVGMFTARELAQSGLKVLLVDRQQCGQESSWAGGGILSPLYPWRYPQAVTRLAAWSQIHYQSIAASIMQRTGIDPQWQRSGMLLVNLKDELNAESWAKQFDIEMLGMMSEKLHQYEPALTKTCQRAIFFANVAQIRNPRLVKALQQELVQLGVEIVENIAVSAMRIKKGVIQGVVATNTSYDASKVVVCGGAWTEKILSGLDLALDLEPVRGQMIMFKAQPGLIKHIILANDYYLIPRQDGRVLAGSTIEYVGFDKTLTHDAEKTLCAEAIELVPALQNVPMEAHWAGLRPGTKNQGIPYISEISSVSGLYINSGHFRNGVVLAPASARLLVDIMLQRNPIVEPGLYAIPS